MPNELDDFLGDLKEVEKDPFEATPDVLETTEEEPVVETEEVEEEKIPYHKDPKVQKFIEKEIEKRMPQVQPTIEKPVEVTPEEDPLVDVLNRVIGNDTPEKIQAIKDFKKALDSRDTNTRAEALKEIDARVNEEKQAEQEAHNELVKGFEDIEDTFKVDITSDKEIAQKTRGEFVDFIKRIAPKDADGQVSEYPDLKESFKLFQDIQKGTAQPKPNRAKELANRSSARSNDASVVQENTDKSWNAVEKWFGKLSG